MRTPAQGQGGGHGSLAAATVTCACLMQQLQVQRAAACPGLSNIASRLRPSYACTRDTHTLTCTQTCLSCARTPPCVIVCVCVRHHHIQWGLRARHVICSNHRMQASDAYDALATAAEAVLQAATHVVEQRCGAPMKAKDRPSLHVDLINE